MAGRDEPEHRPPTPGARALGGDHAVERPGAHAPGFTRGDEGHELDGGRLDELEAGRLHEGQLDGLDAGQVHEWRLRRKRRDEVSDAGRQPERRTWMSPAPSAS